MQGRDSLWICGADHAAIAVHALIETPAPRRGPHAPGPRPRAFLERVWPWREETGAAIIRQYKRLGCSLDYGHERFTMDAGHATRF